MITVQTEYLGGLRTKARHIHSDNNLITDAPIDNKGKGEYFSPTDLVATALGSCMLTIIGIEAEEHGFNITGTVVDITKIMAANPRRISEIIIHLKFPQKEKYSDQQKTIIEEAARSCPVCNSLSSELKKTFFFHFS